MGQPGMRITVDAAMRARDVSRPRPDGEEPPPPRPAAEPEPGRRGKAAKNERRRLDKRGARKPAP
ncbi:hypothetical protein GCM10010191_62850 [Actinomadura vinacea]|uniref:Uncharacterized protein n=1 Tax=Actinomadura vinacea TaxID=115336 RepID=A0ABP5WX95_9ACTN